ncbi:hypothetical protein Rleg4DRAFT_1434 [Rhizobium leguminosarum bv. trifolii WSM2297]|uniref:Uncharacterized protein n=1 Tax=Rhizobium leguminosarum bv. trifolii WSM2297 TaxID=754762 RepID=J0C9U2_RHILT|nr:hypothetical protein Rleg4DRAFT_1434 [Rhizobium leguminosarum bv. trifolii WSM2297]
MLPEKLHFGRQVACGEAADRVAGGCIVAGIPLRRRISKVSPGSASGPSPAAGDRRRPSSVRPRRIEDRSGCSRPRSGNERPWTAAAASGDDRGNHGSPCRHGNPYRPSTHATGNRGDLLAAHPARPSSARHHRKQTEAEAAAVARPDRSPRAGSRWLAEGAVVARRQCRPVRQEQGPKGEVFAWGSFLYRK